MGFCGLCKILLLFSYFLLKIGMVSQVPAASEDEKKAGEPVEEKMDVAPVVEEKEKRTVLLDICCGTGNDRTVYHEERWEGEGEEGTILWSLR